MTTETARDPFALARQGDDAEIRALFRKWIAETRYGSSEIDQEAVEASCERMLDLEQQIDALPAQGAAGLAIKAYPTSIGRHATIAVATR